MDKSKTKFFKNPHKLETDLYIKTPCINDKEMIGVCCEFKSRNLHSA